jgi:nucleoid-associated protein YgaU
MDTKAKVLTFVGGLLLVGLIAYLFLVHGRKPASVADTPDGQTAPKTEIALGPSTQATTAPVDPFAAPTTAPTTEPVVAIPTSDNSDPMIRALEMGPSGMASHNSTLGAVSAESSRTTPKTWKVATGDTLASISTKAYGSARYSSKIAAANPRVNTRSLRAGTVLTLPEINTTPTAASTDHNTAAAGSATPALTGKTYTVKSGDSLRKISAKVYGNQKMWEKIYELNRRAIGPDSTRIRAGMVLQLPEAPTSR